MEPGRVRGPVVSVTRAAQKASGPARSCRACSSSLFTHPSFIPPGFVFCFAVFNFLETSRLQYCLCGVFWNWVGRFDSLLTVGGEGSGGFVESCGDRSSGTPVQGHRPGSWVLPARLEQPLGAGVQGQSFLPSIADGSVASCVER